MTAHEKFRAWLLESKEDAEQASSMAFSRAAHDDEKLRMSHVEAGRALAFAEIITYVDTYQLFAEKRALQAILHLRSAMPHEKFRKMNVISQTQYVRAIKELEKIINRPNGETVRRKRD